MENSQKNCYYIVYLIPGNNMMLQRFSKQLSVYTPLSWLWMYYLLLNFSGFFSLCKWNLSATDASWMRQTNNQKIAEKGVM